jgi:NADH-quinone oxidoreductase subunit L
MVAACGAGAYNAAFFHLVTHAFFKALLFLGAGAVIHAMSDEQDITKMGGIYKQIPITYGLMWIGTLALIGMPFFAGYYSKDAILNAFHLGGNPISYGIGILVVSFTSYYAIRLMILVFHGKPRANDYVMAHIHKLPLTMGMPMIILAIGAIVGGYFGQKLFLHNSKFDWKQSLIIKTSKMQESFIYENIPIIFVAIGVLIFILFVKNIYRNIKKEKMNKILFFLKNKWWIDELYEKIICKPTLIIGKFFAKSVDHLILDRFGPEGFSKLSFLISNQNKPLQTGYVYHYAFIMVIGILILSAILMFMNFYGR